MLRYITDTAGMRVEPLLLIEACIDLLPGSPNEWVTAGGRPHINRMHNEAAVGGGFTSAVAEFAIQLWTGTGFLSAMLAKADTMNQVTMQRAFKDAFQAMRPGDTS